MATTLYFPEEKDPTDVDFYEAEVDATWLGTDTIATVNFDSDVNSGLVVGNSAISGNLVRAQLSGGNLGTWSIEVTVTTSDGRTRQRSVYLVVKQK